MSIMKGGVLIAGAGGGSTSVDNSTITLNQSSQIQAVATKNTNTATGAQAVVYDWVGTYEEWVNQSISTTHPEWICYITDDGDTASPTVIKTVAPHNVGDIFTTIRTDSIVNGAVDCDGSTYSTTDYTGSENIGALLEAGKIDYVSLTDYSTAISTKGWCDKIGWNGTGTTAFRVPTLNAYIWQQLQIPVIGDGITLGVTDGTLTGGVYSQNGGTNSGCFQIAQSSYGSAIGVSYSGSPFANGKLIGLTTDPTKSGVVAGTSNTVSNQRVMIQLATAASDEALITCSRISSDVVDMKAHSVIEFQAPTAQNNYTWYRKYADGWVEMGGLDGGSTQGGSSDRRVNFPLTMADAYYYINCQKTSAWDGSGLSIQVGARDTTGFSWSITYSGSAQNRDICWEVKGMAAS